MVFSIVIPAYNYGHCLTRAVESTLAQNGDDYEIVIIDDGSTDDTPEVGRRLVERHSPKVRYLRQENRGPAAARNRGVDETEGAYLIFLDADDCLLPGALQRFRDYLQAHGPRDMIVAGHLSVHPGGRRRAHPAKPLAEDRLTNFRRYVRRRFGISNGATIMARGIFQKIRYPDQLRNSEDIPVFAQALALFDCASMPEPVLEIHKHDDSLRNDIGAILRSGTEIVDILFDPAILPEKCLGLRDEVFGRQCLSLSRSLYRAGRFGEARFHYLEGLRAHPLLVLEWSYLRKFLRSLGRQG